MKLSQLMDKDRLDLLIQEDLIRVKYSDDGEYRTLGYTDKAQYTKGSWDNPEVQICRGLIVDGEDNVVARPYSKFFNYGQPEAHVDFDAPVEVTDKIDGCFSNKTRLNLWGGGTITIGEVVECKPSKLHSSSTVLLKKRVMEELCLSRGYTYRIVDPPFLPKEELFDLIEQGMVTFMEGYEEKIRRWYDNIDPS